MKPDRQWPTKPSKTLKPGLNELSLLWKIIMPKNASKLASQSAMQSSLLVAFAAVLWATDALVRYPAAGIIDPTFLVFIEHLLVVIVLLPFIVYYYGTKAFDLSLKEWLAAAFTGIGGSALGTVFFTASFLYVNPSVSVLLQKLQPIMVVV